MRQRRIHAVGAAAVAGMLWAVAAPAAVITVGSAIGQPGDTASISVRLDDEGEDVLATQNRIDFSRTAAVAADAEGDPDCSVNPAIDKDATAFRFLPLNCDPAVDCTMVRAFVIAFDNLDPIADGAVLYTCRIAIAADAEAGTYALGNEEAAASGPGGVLRTTTGADGSVEVVTNPIASINAGSASGVPGDVVAVDIRFESLISPAIGVAAVENDLGFPAQTRIPAAAGGGPQCQVNPALDKADTTFAYQPTGCDPASDCTSVRAVVASDSNDDPLPSGAVLYTCTFQIDEAAAVGTYELPVSNVVGRTPAGTTLPAIGSPGSVLVTEPAPTCAGDCDGDGEVRINELLTGVNISVGASPLSACEVLDSDADGAVAINELIQAVNRALSGCEV